MQVPFARPFFVGGEADALSEVVASGWVSHNRVEPSTSASSNVTVPVGSAPMSMPVQLVSLMLASMR